MNMQSITQQTEEIQQTTEKNYGIKAKVTITYGFIFFELQTAQSAKILFDIYNKDFNCNLKKRTNKDTYLLMVESN